MSVFIAFYLFYSLLLFLTGFHHRLALNSISVCWRFTDILYIYKYWLRLYLFKERQALADSHVKNRASLYAGSVGCVLYEGVVCYCLPDVSVCESLPLHYEFISHYKKDFCRYIKDTYDYLSQCFHNFNYLAVSNAAAAVASERALCFFCTVTAFVHPPEPSPAQPLCSMSTAHSSHSNGLVAHTHSRLPLWRLSATVQKTLCCYGSSIQVPQTCSCVKLMAVTRLSFFGFSLRSKH